MRKFFEGLSLSEGALLFSALVLGLCFRIVGLQEITAWEDEVATWYYSLNLSKVVLDSHTPFYYFLCRLWMSVFPDTILSLRFFTITASFLMVGYSCFLAGKSMGRERGILFFVLVWLWPTLVIYDRQARHYSFLADLMLLILAVRNFQARNSKVLWILYAVTAALHPLGYIAALFFILYDYLKDKNLKKRLFEASSILPVLLYYLFRFLGQGQDRILRNISWIKAETYEFLRFLFLLFGGEAYPFTTFYPVGSWETLGLLIGVVLIFLARKEPLQNLKGSRVGQFFCLILFTLICVEAAGAVGVNLRINRYYIFLVPFFLFSLFQTSKIWSRNEVALRGTAIFLLLLSYHALSFRPWSYYEGDDQVVTEVKSEFGSLVKHPDFIICAHKYQYDYYFGISSYNCSEEALKRLKAKKDFYFFDLNGNDKYTAIYLMQNMEAVEYRKYRHAFILNLKPKKESP